MPGIYIPEYPEGPKNEDWAYRKWRQEQDDLDDLKRIAHELREARRELCEDLGIEYVP